MGRLLKGHPWRQSALVAVALIISFAIPQLVQAAIDTAIGKYGASQCLASAASVQLCTGVTGRRRTCAIQNLGPNPIYIGFDTSVTASNGFQIPSGGTFTADVNGGATIYCKAATADQASALDTRWWGLGNGSL